MHDRLARSGTPLAFQCDAQHFVHMIHKVQLHRLLDVIRHLGNVFLVGARQDDFKNAGP